MWVKRDRRNSSRTQFFPTRRHSPKALTRISREIRSWALHHRSDKSLNQLAQMYNPCIRGWITYYSHFYRDAAAVRPLKRIDAYVIRWARRKFKRMRHKTKGARDWFDRLRWCQPQCSLLIGPYVVATAEHPENRVDSERVMHSVLGAPTEVRLSGRLVKNQNRPPSAARHKPQ